MGTGIKIFWALVLIALCVATYFVYQHYQSAKQMEDGAVTCQGCMTPDEKARFDKENSGDTADGQSERKIRTARAEDAAGNPEGAVAAGQVAPTNTPATAPVAAIPTAPATAAAPTAPAKNPIAAATAAVSSFTLGSGSAPASPPNSDTLPANPTNGMHFAGTGSYQWYRQGNLTWRVDTVSGGSCIAFATLEEWRKQIVYTHGCGRGA
jgi:hypothetical protein